MTRDVTKVFKQSRGRKRFIFDISRNNTLKKEATTNYLNVILEVQEFVQPNAQVLCTTNKSYPITPHSGAALIYETSPFFPSGFFWYRSPYSGACTTLPG